MTLIKLSEDHYVLTDDSDISIGNIVAEKLLTGKYELFTIHTLNDIDNLTQKKVIYSTELINESTQPNTEFYWNTVNKLSLSEVKELLGIVDVKKKAWKYNPVKKLDAEFIRAGYVRGYNEALEDNKERKYTEEDVISYLMQSMIQYGIWLENEDDITPGKIVNKMEEIRNKARASLQFKTEWEVEFVDGKLKLKS